MIKSLTISQLLEGCQAEAKHYQQGKKSDESYCLELFRRALVEQDEAAWQAIFTHYQPLVISWVGRYSKFHQTGEEAAFFANDAFRRLWQFASRPETASQLDSLGKCLKYLKMCVGSAIEQHLRRNQKDAFTRAVAAENYDYPVPGAGVKGQRNLLLGELRQILWETVQADKEHLVSEESWIYGFAPRQIQERHPETFAKTAEVSQIKHNILKRLRRRLKQEAETWQ